MSNSQGGQLLKKAQNGQQNQHSSTNGMNGNTKTPYDKENIKFEDPEPVRQPKPQFLEDEVWNAKRQVPNQQAENGAAVAEASGTLQNNYLQDELANPINGMNNQQGTGNGETNEQQAKEEPTFQEMMAQIDREHDSEDEGIPDYKIGGYHPVHIGEVINKRYVVIQKIGWGHFSTVWLARDFKYETYVALKIQKSAPHYLEAAFDEVEILQKVARMSKDPEWMKSLQHYYEGEKKASFSKNDCQVVQLLNSFVYKGPYGNHFCFVFEILGVNLLEVIKRYNYQGVPLYLCRKIAKQVLIGLDFLHRFCSVIHTDLKPENVLLQLTNEEIADIVDNGQITKNVLFSERLNVIRKQLGIHVEEEKIVPPQAATINSNNVQNKQENGNNKAQQSEGENSDKDDDDNDEGDDDAGNLKELEMKLKSLTLNKKQKKNLRKKINMKKKKLASKAIPSQEGEVASQSATTTTKEEEPKSTVTTTANAAPENTQHMSNTALFSQPDTKLLDKNKLMRGPSLDENFKLKIADLGNACWTYHHFATEIQTRQYRSPEVITGSKYNTTADIWSLACMLFEMLTGDFLFEPRKGPTFSKNDDHLAQIEELCKKFPKSFAKRGEKSKKYFDKDGNLRRIPSLQYWPLKSVLVEKYRMKEKEAKALQDFMMPMLHCLPEKRATAKEMLDHPWLKGPTVPYEYKQTEQEHAEFVKKKQIQLDVAKFLGEDYIDPAQEDNEIRDDDIFDGDGEQSLSGDDSAEASPEGDERQVDIKLVDRSFTNLGYIGFGDGIDLGALDNTGNWQFQNV